MKERMNQIIQNLKTGETILENGPSPLVRTGHILIQTTHTPIPLWCNYAG
ncbi:MAG: hypothetical protein WC156_16450 [Pedobacter sp.]